MTDQRVVRSCAKCKQEDNHPRHVVSLEVADPRDPARIIDLTEMKHLDCCAEDGCIVCALDLEHVKSKYGLPLAKALQNKTDDHLAALGEIGVLTVDPATDDAKASN